MGLSEKLTEIKSEVDSLITYANGVTGEADTRLGDAVRTLAEGYGSGGGSGLPMHGNAYDIIKITPPEDSTVLSIDTGETYNPYSVNLFAETLPSAGDVGYVIATFLSPKPSLKSTTISNQTAGQIVAVETTGKIDYWGTAFTVDFGNKIVTFTITKSGYYFKGGHEYTVFVMRNQLTRTS